MEGMNYQTFWKIIKLLYDNDILEHVEVVGSWCEYLYAQSGYINMPYSKKSGKFVDEVSLKLGW